MPLQLLLSDVRLRVQRRADMEFDTSIAVPEWNALISETYRELYGEVEQTGLRFAESTFAITANGSASYTLPTDHLSTLSIDQIIDATTGRRRPLEELMILEHDDWAGRTGEARVFEIVGSNIVLLPAPTTGSYEMRYIPQAPDLSAASDTTLIDVINGDGEAFLIWGAAIKGKTKREEDTDAAITEREGARARMVKWATMRALTQPRRRQVRRTYAGSDSLHNDPANWRFR